VGGRWASARRGCCQQPATSSPRRHWRRSRARSEALLERARYLGITLGHNSRSVDDGSVQQHRNRHRPCTRQQHCTACVALRLTPELLFIPGSSARIHVLPGLRSATAAARQLLSRNLWARGQAAAAWLTWPLGGKARRQRCHVRENNTTQQGSKPSGRRCVSVGWAR